jgi:uncharacterized protein (DUF1697 family)
MRWVAMLRGVNVGGANRLPMADLRETMQALGFENVATYIQSGNVVFDTSDPDTSREETLARRIRDTIAERHGVDVPVVLRSADELVRCVTAHPAAESGIDPKLLHVLFLNREPSDTGETIDPQWYEPDHWTITGREIYVTYPNGSARSKLTIDVFERALGATATARNLNTVRKLAAMLPPG